MAVVEVSFSQTEILKVFVIKNLFKKLKRLIVVQVNLSQTLKIKQSVIKKINVILM